MIECFFGDIENAVESQMPNDYLDKLIEGVFIFSLMWSICGMSTAGGQEILDRFVKNLIDGNYTADDLKNINLNLRDIKAKPNFQLRLPKGASLYDLKIDIDKDSVKWRLWDDFVSTPTFSPESTVSEMIVPTLDTVRCEYLLNLLIANKKHLLLVGPTGTGKTTLIKNTLNKNLQGFTTININFSAQTTSQNAQDMLLAKLEKRKKGVYGPILGQRALCFVDDLNLPVRETYGAQPPIELMRQMLDQGFLYDLNDRSSLKIVDTMFVGAMGPPGGSRNLITPRFMRHLNTISINEYSDKSLECIFSRILSHHFTQK